MSKKALLEAYDPATRWGRPFGYVDWSVYSLGYHRGQDIRKLHPSGRYSVPTDVVSLSGGRVVRYYTGRVTGREIVIDTGRPKGRYEIHCHTIKRAVLWRRLQPGERAARNATAGEKPGTGWGGPHDHFVISDYPDAAHNVTRPVYDPRPFILEALTAAAAVDPPRPLPTPDTPKPQPVPEPEEEDDDMYKPTVHVRTEGPFEATLAHPTIGTDLEQHTGPGTGTKRKSADGKVTVYRGFMVTADPDVYAAWARTHGKGIGNDTSRTDRAGYVAIQVEASRLAAETSPNG